MSIIARTCVGIIFVFLLLSSAQAQWTVVPSGSSNNLRGVFLLDSGVGYAVGEGGTILKSTDAGMTWNALVSGRPGPSMISISSMITKASQSGIMV
jgi:photosystem II stability/assembly factor-like uncharacterized protein